MRTLTQVLIALSVLGFILAVIGSLLPGEILNIESEGYSRACTNLALIAIALSVCFKEKQS